MPLEDILPECPVHILMKKKGVVFDKLQVYSSTSQSCRDCKKNDNACDVYMDWLEEGAATRLATYRDGGVGI